MLPSFHRILVARSMVQNSSLCRGFCTLESPFMQKRSYASATERKKFYESVTIAQGEGEWLTSVSWLLEALKGVCHQTPAYRLGPEGGYEINLDHRKLRTPQGKIFAVPSEPLAIAVATEWDSQRDTIKFFTMHLTTLCNTALDNPTRRDKEQFIRASLKYLDTDTICYRVEEPPGLVELQTNEWDPVLKWAENRYDVVIGSSTSIMGPVIPDKTKEVFHRHLASYNSWSLIGIEFMVTQLKSVILAMGLVDRFLTVQKAVLLSRLEEEYQIQRWGNVEWAHDYDLQELQARTAAGTLFVHLCSSSSTIKHKLLQD